MEKPLPAKVCVGVWRKYAGYGDNREFQVSGANVLETTIAAFLTLDMQTFINWSKAPLCYLIEHV
jgi:hypothetical protein